MKYFIALAILFSSTFTFAEEIQKQPTAEEMRNAAQEIDTYLIVGCAIKKFCADTKVRTDVDNEIVSYADKIFKTFNDAASKANEPQMSCDQAEATLNTPEVKKQLKAGAVATEAKGHASCLSKAKELQ